MTPVELADVKVTGSLASYFLYALAVAVVLLVFVIARTSPRRHSTRSLSGLELQLQVWLWRRQRNREGAILGAIAALGAVLCLLAFFLPVATYTAYPIAPGDPLAGVQEIEPTAKGLALALGLVVALLSVRRAFGGEAVTVLISLLLATLLAFVAALAIADFVANAGTGPDQYMSALVAGPGLFVLPAGAVVAWMACALDVAIGLREPFRVMPREAQPPPPSPLPPPLPPSVPPAFPTAFPPAFPPPIPPPFTPAARAAQPESSAVRLMAQSIASGAALIVLVLVGWLSPPFLIVGTFLVAPNVVLQLYVARRLGRQFHLDRASVAIAAVSLVALVVALGWAILRPDPVFAVPSDAHHVSACGPSVTVPDVGNQVNRSTAGSTTVMTVGSKIYVEDSPVGSAALAALSLDGPDVVCAAGGFGFGESMVETRAGVATLCVRTTDNVTYRIQVQVNS
jgi:hypothetical protein